MRFRDIRVEEAEQERVVGWVYYVKKQAGVIDEEWLTAGRAWVARNLEKLEAAARVLDRFGAALEPYEIPWMVIKGLAFALSVYPDPALRGFGDIDILVPPAYFGDALAVLRDAGFRDARPPAFGTFTDKVSHARVVMHPDEPAIEIDFHFQALEDHVTGCDVSDDWLWTSHKDTKTLNNFGSLRFCVKVPCLEAQVLHGAAHLVAHHHHRPQLVWYLDLALAIRAGLDPARLKALGQASGWLSFLLPVLESLLNHDIPLLSSEIGHPTSAVGCGLSDEVRRLKETVEAWVKEPVVDPEVVATVRRVMKSDLSPVAATARRWRDLRGFDRMRFIGHLLFPTRAYMIERYRPPRRWLWPLMYPYRWLRMALLIFHTHK